MGEGVQRAELPPHSYFVSDCHRGLSQRTKPNQDKNTEKPREPKSLTTFVFRPLFTCFTILYAMFMGFMMGVLKLLSQKKNLIAVKASSSGDLFAQTVRYIFLGYQLCKCISAFLKTYCSNTVALQNCFMFCVTDSSWSFV